MMHFAAPTPTIPIAFNKLLKVVAIVDGDNHQVHALLSRLREAGYEVEVGATGERDAAEDASVGAYILAIDGTRRDPARKFAQAVRNLGFKTPLWALADAHRIADIAV